MFSTPILFIVFNRPPETKMVFEKIRQIKPNKLYVVADGPRLDKPGEQELCDMVRSVVSQIDWDCELKTDFKQKNVGPEVSIKNALNWFFNDVEYGIVLEDDCLPCLSFFTYCDRLLKKFKNDDTVSIISGSNFYNKRISKEYNYFIGDLAYSWGWASWARVFKDFKWGNYYDLEIIHRQLNDRFGNKEYTEHLFNLIKRSSKIEGNWDVELLVNIIMKDKKGIIPSINLISNIGETGTHYTQSESKTLFIPTAEFEFEDGFEDRYIKMSDKVKGTIIRNFMKLTNPLTFRDKLYLIKIRLKEKLKIY